MFFFQAEDGIRDIGVTGVQTCALPILPFGTYKNAIRRGVCAGAIAPARAFGTSASMNGSAIVTPKPRRKVRRLKNVRSIGVKIGRGLCRERVEISGGAVSLKKKKRGPG